MSGYKYYDEDYQNGSARKTKEQPIEKIPNQKENVSLKLKELELEILKKELEIQKLKSN